MELILATKDLIDIKMLDSDIADFESGIDTNDFEVRITSTDYGDEMGMGAIIYIPYTEAGGVIDTIETNTSADEVTFRGYTWRGLLDQKIIIPNGDYYVASGDLTEIMDTIIETYFDRVFTVDPTLTGIVVNSYRFDRYCTILEGFEKLLTSVGYKLTIRVADSVILSASPIKDYSQETELSQDSELDFKMKWTQGITTMICLGKGELSARQRVDLYLQGDGSIGTTQVYFGMDERVYVYENNNAENLTKLEEEGRKKFAELIDSMQFDMDIEQLGLDIDIGDIIGGRDYITGMSMKEQITGKVWRLEGGEPSITYRIGGN